MNPKVKSVTSNNNFTLNLIFEDNTHRLFDVKPYLEMGDFTDLKDLSVFNSAHVFMGTVQWDNELDISPDTLFLESKELVG